MKYFFEAGMGNKDELIDRWGNALSVYFLWKNP